MKEWQNSFDKDGRILSEKSLKARIFRGGLESNELRREVWKYLLNYYPWTSTRDERAQLIKQRHVEYHAMKLQWKSISDQQKERNSVFRDRESLICKKSTDDESLTRFLSLQRKTSLELIEISIFTTEMIIFIFKFFMMF